MENGQVDLQASVYILNPEKVINDAIERGDWFSGFSNSVSYFEYYGYKKLNAYCKEKDVVIDNLLKKFNIKALTITLYITGLIDQNTFNKMLKTIEERNKLIHPVGTDAGIDYRDRKQRDRAKELLEDALYCIGKLR
jgi:hypothetical protein